MSEEKRTVHIWDDPESRINFLETVLKGQSWEAKVYQPPVPGAEPLQNFIPALNAKGYVTKLGQDENGLTTLDIKNFGNDTTLVAAVKEMGLSKGFTYKLKHINEPLGNAMHKTKELLGHVAGDKARLIGGLYLLGDVFLIGAGFGNKDHDAGGHSLKGAFKDPANMLQSLTGVAATIQSLIYMAFAKEGGEAVYSDLMKKAEKATAEGKDLFDDALWKDGGSKRPGLGIFNKIFKDHPLEAGAAAQILGQVSLIGSGGIRLTRAAVTHAADPVAMAAERKGAIQDMITGVNSITGWSLMMKKPKQIDDEDKLPWSNPKRVWQEAQENPSQFSSMFLGVASVAGVGAAISKKNNVQLLANATYLVGDGVMFMTKSEHYGAAGMSNPDLMAEAAEKFITTSPMVLGQEEMGQFTQQLSGYIAERALHEIARKEKREVTPKEIEEFSVRIAQGLNAKLPSVHPKTYEVADRAAAVVSMFHPSFAKQISGELAAAICEAPSVMIKPEELQQAIMQQVDLSPTTDMVEMKKVAKPVSELAFAIPGGATPERVNRLYDAIDDLVRPDPNAGLQAEQALVQTAERDIQAAVQQSAQNAGVGPHAAALQASRATQGFSQPQPGAGR